MRNCVYISVNIRLKVTESTLVLLYLFIVHLEKFSLVKESKFEISYSIVKVLWLLHLVLHGKYVFNVSIISMNP